MSDTAALLPRVSIIVRTRNRPTMLGQALRDVFAQTYQDFEIVLVDDSDEPAAVLSVVESMPGAEGRVRIIDNTASRHGRAIAANVGVRAARGELVVLHDDDDSWADTFLAATVGHLDANPDSVAVSAHTEVVVHRTNAEGASEPAERILLNPDLTSITILDMVQANRVTTNSLLYRASIHAEIGYIDESLAVHEDWEFYLRLIAAHPIDLLPLPALAFWHHRPESTGDEGNSVFALSNDHDASHARVREDHIRKTVARIGWGTFFQAASDAQRVSAEHERTEAQRVREHSELSARIDTLSRQLDDLQSSIAQLRDVTVDRTSISSLFRRMRAVRPRRG